MVRNINIIILIYFIFSATFVSAQTEQSNAPTTQTKPKVVFSQNINLSNRELDWSKTYYLSFQKTHEARYLLLAAAHCGNAITLLKATQEGFPNTTRFHYKAKKKRYTACRFYEQLQETAQRLGPKYHIGDLSKGGCDF